MVLLEQYFEEDIYFIDIVEYIVEYYEWIFDCIVDDQIVMVIEGQWKIYFIMFVWLGYEEMFKMVCFFEMEFLFDCML